MSFFSKASRILSSAQIDAGVVENSDIANDTITNAKINSAAAIAYSKLALTGGIVNADVAALAAIAYSKLNLALAIVNGDISAAAAIALSKLGNVGADNAFIRSDGASWVSEIVNMLEKIASGSGTGAATIAITDIPAKKHILIVASLDGNANVGNFGIRFNNDSGTNYATRRSDNGGAETTTTSADRAIIGTPSTGDTRSILVIYISNISAIRKTGYYFVSDGGGVSAATAPGRVEGAIKWDNVAAQITRVDIIRDTGTLDGDTIVNVFGWD